MESNEIKFNFTKAMQIIALENDTTLRKICLKTPYRESSIYRTLRTQNPKFNILASLAQACGVAVHQIVEKAEKVG